MLLGRAVGQGEKVAHTKTETSPCRCWELEPCHREASASVELSTYKLISKRGVGLSEHQTSAGAWLQ